MPQPATQKQLQYIASLSHRAGLSHSASHGIAAVLGKPQEINSEQASRVIDDLKTRTVVIRRQYQLARLTFRIQEAPSSGNRRLFDEVTSRLRQLGAQYDPATGVHHITPGNARTVVREYTNQPKVTFQVLFPPGEPESATMDAIAERHNQEQQENHLRHLRHNQRAHMGEETLGIIQDTLDQLLQVPALQETSEQWQTIGHFVAGLETAMANQHLGMDASTARWTVRWSNAAQQNPLMHQPQEALAELRTALESDLEDR